MLIKKIKNNNYKNILKLLTGTSIAQAIPIALSPVLTRIYSPEDFGILAMYVSILAIFATVATARYELAIMLPKEDTDAKNIVVLSIFISLCISSTLFFMFLILGENIANLLGNEEIYTWLFFIPIAVATTGIYQALNYWSTRNKEYNVLAANKITQSVSNVGINLIIGIFKTGPTGLILGSFFSQILITIRLMIVALANRKDFFEGLSYSRIKKMARRYDQFPKISVWSAVLNTVSVQLPIFILAIFFNGLIVGYYSLAHRVLNIPMTILGGAVAQVFFQVSSDKIKENPSDIKDLTFNSYKKLLIVGLIPMSILFAFGDVIFGVVFGENWTVAGDYARLLSIWLLLVFISSPLSLLFTVLEKEGTALVFNIMILFSRVISLLVGAIILKDAYLTILLFGISGAVFWLWYCVYILKLVGITYKKSFIYTVSYIVGGFSFTAIIRTFFIT